MVRLLSFLQYSWDFGNRPISIFPLDHPEFFVVCALGFKEAHVHRALAEDHLPEFRHTGQGVFIELLVPFGVVLTEVASPGVLPVQSALGDPWRPPGDSSIPSAG